MTYIHRLLIAIGVFFIIGWHVVSLAFSTFIVRDVRVEGLQVLTPEIVLKDLSIRIGEPFTEEASRNVIRQLYSAGQYDEVQLGQDGEVLVIYVKERPVVTSIEITGNEDIGTPELLDALKTIGLSEGDVFNQAVLERVERELRQQYFSVGKYNVQILSEVEPLEKNRVAVKLTLHEGDAAKIKAINIIGNKVFDDEELLEVFQSKDEDWLAFMTKSTQYSKQRLSGDLEALRSYYMDKGYANFRIDSTQVSITPDKSGIYVTVNVREGEKHVIGSVDVAGDLVVPKEDLLALAEEHLEPGEIFSRKQITAAQNAIVNHLGEQGYILGNVNVSPEIQEEDKMVNLTFFVNPGRRVYVRRINFYGNTQTEDSVLRQEMRQMEQSWANAKQIQRSKTRLERLGFFSKVGLETPGVSEAGDKVDVNYSVEEQPAGQLSVGVGFSQGEGLLLNGGISHKNFLGSGKFVSANINTSESHKVYNFAFNDPYFTKDGISLGYRLFYRERDTDAVDADLTDYSIDTLGLGANFGVPLSEHDRARFSLNYKRLKLKTGAPTAYQINDFILDDDGNDIQSVLAKCSPKAPAPPPDGNCIAALDAAADDSQTYDTFVISFSYAHDTRNRGVFATDGVLQSIGLDFVIPGSDLEYGKAFYRGEWYVPFQKKRGFFKEWSLRVHTEVAYGFSYGGTDNLPFFENFYAGGINSIRGFEDNSIGPRELLINNNGEVAATGDPTGGDLRILGGLDIIFPTPFLADNPALRTNLFVDLGNLVDTQYDEDDFNEAPGFDAPDYNKLSDFRGSFGVGLNWLSAFGALSFSVAKAVREEDDDETQVFQFSIGSSF